MRRIHLPFILLVCPFALSAQEICNNGIDDDDDGLIDLNDTTDCVCNGMAPLLQSILPNPSFEDHTCEPTTWSQTHCVEGWAQGTGATEDYLLTPSYMPAWIEQPLPGGGFGCVGGYFCPNWKEYIAACLGQPMLAGEPYSLNMSVVAYMVESSLTATSAMNLGPVDVTIYGMANCPSFPTGSGFCPGNEGWTELGYTTYEPSNSWSQVTITFVPPFDVQAIMIGAPCELPPDYPDAGGFNWMAYFLFDELSLGLSVQAIGSLCVDGVTLTYVPQDSSLTEFQWYHDGIAIIGATDTALTVTDPITGPGTYQLIASSDSLCTSGTYVLSPPVYPEPLITWDNDELFCEQGGAWQWYLNGSMVDGATGQSLLLEENGQYQVEVTDTLTGCSGISAPFAVINLLTAAHDGTHLMVNAPFGAAYIEVGGVQAPVLFELFDASGKRLATERITGARWRYDTGALPAGVYLVRLDGHALRIVR